MTLKTFTNSLADKYGLGRPMTEPLLPKQQAQHRDYSPLLQLANKPSNPEDLRMEMRGLFRKDLLGSAGDQANALMAPAVVSPASLELAKNPFQVTGTDLRATGPLRGQ